MDLVSVIMPAYNAGSYITQAIESVRVQSYTNWQLVVVDDGSTDDTAAIVKGFEQLDNRVNYIYQSNKRLSAARNTGIKNSKGVWIAFLDSDDLWHQDKLQKQMFIASTSADIDVIYTNGYIFHKDDLTDLTEYPTKFGKFSGDEMYKMQYQTNYIPVLSVIVKKSVVDKVGWQDENLRACEDWDYWIRIAKAGSVFFGIPDKLFYYRRHDSNMSSNILSMKLAQATVFIKNFDKERFSKFEISKIFKPLIAELLINLISNNQLNEAQILIKSLTEKFSFFPYKFYYTLLEVFKRHALLPIKIVNKIDSLQKN